MKKFITTIMAVFVAGFAICQTESLQEQQKGKPILTVFSNFYTGFGEQKDNIGFELERAYLGYQYQFTDALSAKVVFDMGQSGDVNDIQRIAYVKNAFATWKKGAFKLHAGLTGLEQFSLQEQYWGHRYVMKPFLDEYKFGSSADLGIVARYQFGSWGSIDFSCVNGEGYKKIQLDNQMLYSAGFTVTPVEGLALRIYGDYKGKQNPDSTESARKNLSFFAGYQTKRVSVGAEYNKMFNSKNKVGKHQEGVSAYASVSLPNRFGLYARWDYLMSDNDWNIEKDGQLFMAGVQYAPCKNIKLTPNFRLWKPAAVGSKVAPTLYLNMEAKL